MVFVVRRVPRVGRATKVVRHEDRTSRGESSYGSSWFFDEVVRGLWDAHNQAVKPKT